MPKWNKSTFLRVSCRRLCRLLTSSRHTGVRSLLVSYGDSNVWPGGFLQATVPRRSRTINFWMPHSPNRCSGVCAVVYVSTYVSPPVPNNHWLSPNRKLTLFFQQPSCHSAINTSRYSTHYSLYHPHTSDNVSWNMSMWIFTQSIYDRAKTFGHVFHRRPPFFFLNLSLGFAMKLILFFKFKFQCLHYLIQTLDVWVPDNMQQRKTHTNWQKLKTNKQTNKQIYKKHKHKDQRHKKAQQAPGFSPSESWGGGSPCKLCVYFLSSLHNGVLWGNMDHNC